MRVLLLQCAAYSLYTKLRFSQKRAFPNNLYKRDFAMPGVFSSGSASVDAQQTTSACTAYDFGFDNPQYSDRVLHILQETDDRSAEAQGPAKQATVLRSMHVNSLTLAANSEVLRCKDYRMLKTNKHSMHCVPCSEDCVVSTKYVMCQAFPAALLRQPLAPLVQRCNLPNRMHELNFV